MATEHEKETAKKAEHDREAARKAANAADQATRQLTQSGAEAAERTAQAANDVAKDNLTTFRRMADDSVERFSQMFGLGGDRAEELTQQTSHNLDILMRSSSVLAEGYQSIYQEWLGLTQRTLQKNMDDLSSLMSSRTPQDLVATQTDILKSRIEDMLQSMARISELSSKVANNAIKKIGEEGENAPKHRARRRA